MKQRKITLLLDNGMSFQGKSFGYDAPVSGEVVFNTAMSGYPESLTDPSYAGQILVLTYPLIGNYGVAPFSFEPNGLATFMESEKIHVRALIVSSYSEAYSHWNSRESLSDWLKREHIPAVSDIDTRQLTKVLREQGVMTGRLIFDDEDGDSSNISNEEDVRSEYARTNWVDKDAPVAPPVAHELHADGVKEVLRTDGLHQRQHGSRGRRDGIGPAAEKGCGAGAMAVDDGAGLFADLFVGLLPGDALIVDRKSVV